MRKLVWSLVAVVALTGSLIGCGGSTPRTTGKAGADGGAAGTGAAGTGAAGTGTAGTAAAGDGTAGTGTAGTGAAGTGAAGTGTAGTGAAGEPPPPPPTFCDTHPHKNLPYNIAADFKVVHI